MVLAEILKFFSCGSLQRSKCSCWLTFANHWSALQSYNLFGRKVWPKKCRRKFLLKVKLMVLRIKAMPRTWGGPNTMCCSKNRIISDCDFSLLQLWKGRGPNEIDVATSKMIRVAKNMPQNKWFVTLVIDISIILMEKATLLLARADLRKCMPEYLAERRRKESRFSQGPAKNFYWRIPKFGQCLELLENRKHFLTLNISVPRKLNYSMDFIVFL